MKRNDAEGSTAPGSDEDTYNSSKDLCFKVHIYPSNRFANMGVN
jgi:hypothetical protein